MVLRPNKAAEKDPGLKVESTFEEDKWTPGSLDKFHKLPHAISKGSDQRQKDKRETMRIRLPQGSAAETERLLESLREAARIQRQDESRRQTKKCCSVTLPAANPWSNAPVVRLPGHVTSNQQPVGSLNGDDVCVVPPAAPQTDANKSKKRKHEDGRVEEQPHVNKPPNAFMWFLKEQRSNVKAQLNIRDSAAGNKDLGERRKSLSEERRAKYIDWARRDARLHAQRFLEWSSGHNYEKKRTSIRAHHKDKYM